VASPCVLSAYTSLSQNAMRSIVSAVGSFIPTILGCLVSPDFYEQQQNLSVDAALLGTLRSERRGSARPSLHGLFSVESSYCHKSEDKNPLSQQSVNVLYCVLSMITTCFGLRKRPSLGDYHVVRNIKKKVTFRCNGSVESNSRIIG
jgi:hypothetical protein